MKSGSTLIEFVIAILIASLLGSALLTALYQSSRFQTVLDGLVSVYMRVGIVSNQLEKDLMGAFIPVSARIEQKKEEDKKGGEQKEEKNGEKKPLKPLEKIFYSENKNDTFESLTFITNNPMTIFVSKDAGKIKPRVARVIYTLRLEPERKDSFVLLRQEGTELELAPYKDMQKFRAHELISGIKNFSVSFTARIEKKEEKTTAQAQEQQKITYDYKKVKAWTSELKKEKDEGKKEEEMPRIPHFVEITLTLWDQQYTKDETFVLSFEIPTDTNPVKAEQPKKEEKVDDKNAKPEQKTAMSKKKKKEKQQKSLDSLTLSLEKIMQIFAG